MNKAYLLRLIERVHFTLWALLVCYIYDITLWCKDIWYIYFIKQHQKIAYEQPGLASPILANKVAIIAVYPDNHSLFSIKNLATSFLENGFYVLMVSGKELSKELRLPLLPFCHILVERFPIGRDFASYKYGVRWINENKDLFPNLEAVALANDSLFYPKSFSKTVKQ